MESLFADIFSIEGVLGALYLTEDGATEFSKFMPPLSDTINEKNFINFVGSSIDLQLLKDAIDDTNESLLIFEKNRLYIKKTMNGFVMIIMGMFVPVAMVRLNCQIIVPEIDKLKKQKGLGRFFKK